MPIIHLEVTLDPGRTMEMAMEMAAAMASTITCRQQKTPRSCQTVPTPSMMKEVETILSRADSVNSTTSLPREQYYWPTSLKIQHMKILQTLLEVACFLISTFAPTTALQAFPSWKKLLHKNSSPTSSDTISTSRARGLVWH